MIRRTVLVAVLVVAVGTAPVAAANSSGGASAYSGTHVSFGTEGNAVVDYAVDGTTMLESVAVQSASEAESGGGVSVGADLSSVTTLTGSALSVDARTGTSATVTAESGATLSAHDNARGILVVDSGGESQYVTADVASSSSAESEGDGRVVVTAEDGTKGTFLVVGDGDVTVNEEGDVSARLGSDGRLVFRSCGSERSENEKRQERLIAEGEAAAEVYVMEKGDGSGELAADVVTYGEDTTVEVTERSEGTVRMTADRSASQGTVVVTTVSESAMSSVEDAQVTVDGEAAVKASSYGELERAANGGEASKYMVRQGASGDARAQVLVGVNHFSEREIAMTDGSADGGSADDGSGDSGSGDADGGSGDAGTADGGDGGSTDGSDGDSGSSANAPGFGAILATIALLGGGLIAARRG